MTSTLPPTRQAAQAAGLLGALAVVLAWVYWPTLTTLVGRWSDDPQYTHGYVVPVFAAVVLWFRRSDFPSDRVGPSWWGAPLIVLAAVLRLLGAAFAFEWLEAGSLAPALAGLVLLTMGPAVARWAWPVAAFLAFVLPWPWQFDQLLTHPLRRVATLSSTYLLQTLGLPALSRGNVIVIDEQEVGVAEACSGLGMLMTFFALSTAVALVIRRQRLERLAIFLSAVPIGVLMNVLRITVTVWLYQVADERTARIVFHDVAGWVMMPAALATMWLESLYLRRLWRPVVEVEAPVPVPAAQASSSPPHWARRGAASSSRPEATAQQPLLETRDATP
jgi:exosortase